MTLFREMSAAACILGVVFSVIGSLVPSEKFMPQIRMIFALILVLVIVPGAAGADISFEFPDLDEGFSEDGSGRVDRLIIEAVPENICDSLEEILLQNEITPLEISVNINNSGDGSIFITSAEIILPRGTAQRDIDRAQLIAEQALWTDKITVKAE